jgi:tRNA threonylcarbamoyladenosine biosynthesis protein TsaB
MKNLTLLLDSSAVPLICAITDGKKLYRASKTGIKQENYLFPLLKNLLKKFKAELKDIDSCLFVKGPGRFTGIRIGITLASMLKEFAEVKIASLSVFDILKYQAQNSADYKKEYGDIMIILPAFRQEYFLSFKNKEIWTTEEEISSLLKKQKTPLFICGWAVEGKNLKEIFTCKKAIFAPSKLNKISFETMAKLAQKYCGKQKLEEVLTPLYLKPARFELTVVKKAVK